ncbi:MAG: hypothetical protein PHU86_01965, partial [Patescibacteria group bacterium]|nr:hypothetical protein [Patescibacteria group bacterium]
MFFKRHKPEEPTENENPISSELSQSKPTEGAYPGVEQLPDTLKLIDRKGREDGGWLFDTGPMEPTGDDIISVFRHATDGRIEYKHVPYKDLVEWNIGDNVDNIEEHNMTETTQPGSDDEADQSMSDEEKKVEEEKRIRDGAARFTQLYQPEDFPEVTIPTPLESPMPPEPIPPTVETGHEEPTPPLFAQPLSTDRPEPAEPPNISVGIAPPETEVPPAISTPEPVPPAPVGTEANEPSILGAASEVLYWDDGNYDRDRTGEVIERNGIKYEVRRLADDTQPSRYYLVPEGMKDEDIPEEFLHPGEAGEMASGVDPTTTPPPGGVGRTRDDSGPSDGDRTEEIPRAEATPVDTEPTPYSPSAGLLQSVRDVLDALPNSAAKKGAKERIEGLLTIDSEHTHKGGDLGDSPEQSQARIDLKVEKLIDNLEGLKTPLSKTKEKDGRTAEDSIALQAQLLLNISEKNKYNEINRENLEKTIRLAATLIGHDQEAIKKAAVKGSIEAATNTIAQLKEYIAKAKEDAVYMSTPGAQETLAGYQRTIDRLETILQGSIHNHAIDEVVAE